LADFCALGRKPVRERYQSRAAEALLTLVAGASAPRANAKYLEPTSH
jgi:hypothetical protein